MRIVKIRSQKWFNENAYKDDTGDWWENKAKHDEFEIYTSSEPALEALWIFTDQIDQILDHDSEFQLHGIDWAIERELPKEDYPEYYL